MGWKKKREEAVAEAAAQAELESLWLPEDFMADEELDHILTQQSDSDFLTPVDTLSGKTNTEGSGVRWVWAAGLKVGAQQAPRLLKKHNFFLTNIGFPNRGGGGPRLGKNSHIFPFFCP